MRKTLFIVGMLSLLASGCGSATDPDMTDMDDDMGMRTAVVPQA